MSAATLLTAIAADAPGAFDRLLHNCRFEGMGMVAYGGEAIGEAIRPHGALLGESGGDPRTASHADMAALVGQTASGAPIALFADAHQGWITRLWMLGPFTGDAPLPKTDVPADFDLDQRGGSLGFDPSDHPALNPAHRDRLIALGRQWLDAAPPAIVAPLRRPRPLVLRAFSHGDRTAALFRVQGATGHGLAGFYAAAMWEGAEPVVVVDEAGRRLAAETPWSPVLRSAAG